MNEEKASKGPKKRDPRCLVARYDITIPAGTILRQDSGKAGTFSCQLAGGKFIIERVDADMHPGSFKWVIA